MASLRSCVIARYMEFKERVKVRTIAELKEELVRLRESHSREVRLLEEKVRKVKDRHSTE